MGIRDQYQDVCVLEIIIRMLISVLKINFRKCNRDQYYDVNKNLRNQYQEVNKCIRDQHQETIIVHYITIKK